MRKCSAFSCSLTGRGGEIQRKIADFFEFALNAAKRILSIPPPSRKQKARRERDFREHCLVEAICKNYGYKWHEVYESLTWPQIYLLLDGAGYNVPAMEDDNEPDVPDKPDIRREPVEFLRWQFLYAPGVPAHIRKPTEEVEVLCQRFAGEIERGEKVWSEEDFDWIRVNRD